MKVLLMSLILLVGFHASADRKGNGADNVPVDDGAAWFLGSQPIKYCIVKANQFPFSDSAIKNLLENTFRTWASYLDKKKINSPDFMGYGRGDVTANFNQYKINTRIEYLENCDGREDIKFYFGINSVLTQRYKKDFSNPVAFSQRISYDANAGWGKGLVWIAPSLSVTKNSPNWNLPYRLQGTLLHEVGHILGNGHVEGTIMTRRFAEVVSQSDLSEAAAKHFFTQIDHSKELYVCENCAVDISSNMKVKDSEINAFKAFIGRDPIGKVSIRIVSSATKGVLILMIGDETSSWNLPLKIGSEELSRTEGESPIFKKAIALRYGSNQSKWLTTNSISYSAQGMRHNGEVVTLVVTRNDLHAQFSLRFIEEGKPTLCFSGQAAN